MTRTTSRSKSVPPGEQGESPAPLAEIKARHVVNSWQDPGPRCDWDFMRWPCDAARLLARIEELEKGLRAILREHGEDTSENPNHCRICGTADGVWQLAVLEARAALGGEE